MESGDRRSRSAYRATSSGSQSDPARAGRSGLPQRRKGGSLIRTIQRQLTLTGHYRGPIDGNGGSGQISGDLEKALDAALARRVDWRAMTLAEITRTLRSLVISATDLAPSPTAGGVSRQRALALGQDGVDVEVAETEANAQAGQQNVSASQTPPASDVTVIRDKVGTREAHRYQDPYPDEAGVLQQLYLVRFSDPDGMPLSERMEEHTAAEDVEQWLSRAPVSLKATVREPLSQPWATGSVQREETRYGSDGTEIEKGKIEFVKCQQRVQELRFDADGNLRGQPRSYIDEWEAPNRELAAFDEVCIADSGRLEPTIVGSRVWTTGTLVRQDGSKVGFKLLRSGGSDVSEGYEMESSGTLLVVSEAPLAQDEEIELRFDELAGVPETRGIAREPSSESGVTYVRLIDGVPPALQAEYDRAGNETGVTIEALKRLRPRRF